MIDPRWVPLGVVQISTASLVTAQNLPAIPAGATAALIRVEGTSAVVRWRDDGTAPSSTVGMIMNVGDNPLWYPGTLSAIQFITASGAANILDVAYYR